MGWDEYLMPPPHYPTSAPPPPDPNSISLTPSPLQFIPSPLAPSFRCLFLYPYINGGGGGGDGGGWGSRRGVVLAGNRPDPSS